MDDIELSEHDKAFIRRQMESGDYGSAGDVISAGLRMLEEQDALRETWLRDEIATRLDELESYPERTIPAEKVFANLEARHKARLPKTP